MELFLPALSVRRALYQICIVSRTTLLSYLMRMMRVQAILSLYRGTQTSSVLQHLLHYTVLEH